MWQIPMSSIKATHEDTLLAEALVSSCAANHKRTPVQGAEESAISLPKHFVDLGTLSIFQLAADL